MGNPNLPLHVGSSLRAGMRVVFRGGLGSRSSRAGWFRVGFKVFGAAGRVAAERGWSPPWH